MDIIKVGLAIKKLRNKAGYTQHDVARYLDVTDKAVSKWERGLSVPDISIITKLSIFLNCDVDNLLEGNLSYLEEPWTGFLHLNVCDEIFSGTIVYGKPLVYFFLSYFLLAGIKNIYIACPKRDKDFIEKEVDSGERIGVHLHFLPENQWELPFVENTMVVYDNPFVYGPNLTKYFQRAMSRMNGVTCLSSWRNFGYDQVVFDNFNRAEKIKACNQSRACVPIAFYPQKYVKRIADIKEKDKLIEDHLLYIEPMGNGMVTFSVTNTEELFDVTCFCRFIERTMGQEIYNIFEVAKNRNLID